MEPKYPQIEVQLSDEDGNVFSIIGRVVKAMRRGGVPAEEISAYQREVMASESYDKALQSTMSWVATL